jgi:tetratricopeptide (TPR) repeat protein
LALEPNNPSHYTNLGRVYVSVADRARLLKDAEDEELAATAAKAETDQLAAAEQAFLTAIQTKLDYAPAHYYLASVYERQGRVEEAITRLAALRDARPNDVGLGFQLAVLYMKTEQYDLSRKELERIVAIFPTYSNALWYLSALYELDGDEAKALSAANKVLELNPDNQAAKQRVKNLRSGVTGSGIPEPVEEGENGATDSDDDVSGDGDGIIESDTE